MAKFLVRASYTTSGVQGLIKDGGSGRKAAVDKALSAVGGSVESFYYAFGDEDALVIIDVPDATTALGISMAARRASATSPRGRDRGPGLQPRDRGSRGRSPQRS